MVDIYNVKKQIENQKAKVNEANISEKNKELILEYCNERANGFFGKEIGKQRLLKLYTFCRLIVESINKDMDTLEETDVKKYLIKLNESDYSEWTRSDYKKILKLFLTWLKKKKGLKLKLDFFNTTTNMKKVHKLKREDFLFPKEIKVIIESTNNIRDYCLIYMAWDLGARIGELANGKIKDVLLDDEGGATINLNGKTGERSPYIIESVPSITRWLSIHPKKDDPNAPLFVGLGKSINEGKPLCYRTLYKIFQKAMEKSGLKKKFNPHLFRHSRALWAAQNNWNNQMANAFFGWSDNSNMFSYYINLGSTDLKNHMKSMYGEVSQQEVKREEFTKCKCGVQNNKEADYCHKCGALLNHNKALIEDRVVLSKTQLKQQQQFMEMMTDYIKSKENNISKEELIKKWKKQMD